MLGLLPLFNSINNPRLAAADGADYVRLIAVGWCFGIGAALLFGPFFQGRLSRDRRE